MTTLLVVDDQASNRELLITLLGYAGYSVLSAVDGRDGLAQVREHRPDLVICDILMPIMDGYEFVRHLRSDSALAATRVIFYTAYYHEREAGRLAAAGGVSRVLLKPAEPAAILAAVREVLELPAVGADVTPDFEHAHLRLLSDKLAGTTSELVHANAQLGALIDLNLQLASEHDPVVLLDKVCAGARSLLGARHAMLRVTEPKDPQVEHLAVSGFDAVTRARLLEPAPRNGLVEQVRVSAAVLRRRLGPAEQAVLGLPTAFPEVASAVIAPIRSLTQRYGWLCLADKLDADEFNDADAELLRILAAQVGRIYENGSLYRRVREHAAGLEREIQRRQQAERELRAQYAVSRVLADSQAEQVTIGLLLETLCKHLGFTTAALWEVDRGVGTLRHVEAWPDIAAWSAVVHAPSSSIAGRVWRASAPLWVADARELGDPPGSAGAVTSRPDAALAFPVHLHGEVTGVIELRGERTQSADGSLLDTCRTIGTQIAQYMERREQHRNIERLNRIHALLSGINSAIVRIQERQILFEEACRIAVELGGFGIASIGEVDAGSGTLRTRTWAGVSAAELADIEAMEHGGALADGGIVARAMHSRKVTYTNDVLGETGASTRRYAIALRHGYRSVIALPLMIGEQAVGCLALYAREADFFNDDELRLLDELAGDIAFALRFIGNRESLAYLARHDPLTGLLNRAAFLERIEQLLASGPEETRRVAVVIGNLRRFRHVNESFGRPVGDALLCQLAERLRASWPDPHALARIGADSFAGALLDFGAATDIAHLIEQLGSELYAQPFQLGEHALSIGFSLGVALYPHDADNGESLLHHAEAALNDARLAGDRYRYYQPEMTARIAQSLRLENRLRGALDNEQFVLHYQPKVDVASRRTHGLEALIRWQDPDEGLVAPGAFIPILEESGMIVEVGFWALCRAMEDARRWRERALRPSRIAVNVSALQLRQANFVETVRQALRAYGGDEVCIDIEITESIIMKDIDANIGKLAALRDMGLSIAIDDFGTGYSSLAYLARLPVTALKIDRSFIATMTTSPESMSIVSTTISLAHSLGLQVIAEGVESEDQARLLHLLRCDQMQGYLICRPQPPDALDEFLR